jgi:hypothetical protein
MPPGPGSTRPCGGALPPACLKFQRIDPGIRIEVAGETGGATSDWKAFCPANCPLWIEKLLADFP